LAPKAAPIPQRYSHGGPAHFYGTVSNAKFSPTVIGTAGIRFR
jgi:hypothetical protein